MPTLPHMHLFIDANIFLDYYEATKSELDDLAKMRTLIKKDGATLYLPDQVIREFWKNREGSISKALRAFQKDGRGSVPRLAMEDVQYAEMMESYKKYETIKNIISTRIKKAVADENTIADDEVRALFAVSHKIDTSGGIFSIAQERALRHNPPGKKDGLGDRISWVSLLQTVPNGSDLHVISADGDFATEEEGNGIKPYLAAEWKTKKGGKVKLWERASQFLAAHFPDAANSIQIELTLLVSKLEDSPSFAKTHHILSEFDDVARLTLPLVERIAQAILTNHQINSILEDEDVFTVCTKFMQQHGKKLKEWQKEEIQKLLSDAGVLREKIAKIKK